MGQIKVKVLFSGRAEKDFADIYQYLSEHSPQALVKVDEVLMKALRRLGYFPQSGHFVKAFRGQKYREVTVFHYRVIYHYVVKKKTVHVLTIRHGKRFLPNVL